MRRCGRNLAAAAAVLLATAANARAGGTVAFDDPRLAAPSTLTVSIPNVTPGGLYPANFTADGRNISPAVSWTAGPPSTRNYVLILQDSDAPGPVPAVHWLLYDVPASVTSLPRYLRNEAAPSKPLGSAQGPNDHGSFGYSGPRPLVGDPAHHYHLQVFALDRPLKVRPGAALSVVERAMAGRVVARGELVATYAAPNPNAQHGKTEAPGTSAPPP